MEMDRLNGPWRGHHTDPGQPPTSPTMSPSPAMAGSRFTAPTSAEAELLLLQKQALVEEEEAKAKRELLTHFLQVRDPTAASLDCLQTPSP